MITNFNTPQVGGKSGSNQLMTVVLVIAAGYLVYRFVVKPMLDKENENA
jgi:peptidoglycan/LPS O-acetylase OafA/YrhL